MWNRIKIQGMPAEISGGEEAPAEVLAGLGHLSIEAAGVITETRDVYGKSREGPCTVGFLINPAALKSTALSAVDDANDDQVRSNLRAVNRWLSQLPLPENGALIEIRKPHYIEI